MSPLTAPVRPAPGVAPAVPSAAAGPAPRVGQTPRRRLHVLGDTLDVLLASHDTDGQLSVLLMHNPASAQVPPHAHDVETESFYVLEGTYEFTLNGVVTLATPGMTVCVPPGATHAFRVLGGEPAKALVMTTPAGIERFFAAVDALSVSGPVTPQALCETASRFGVRLIGAPRDLAND